MKTKPTLLLYLLAVLAVCGCSPDRYAASERGLQAFGKTYVAAVRSGAVKDKTAIAAGRALINEWNSANKELNLARLNGDFNQETYWLNRLESILLRAAEWGNK